MTTTVMVTGVGAIIGYGLLRSLRAARPEARLVGADIFADAAGRAWCDVFEQAPLTASPGYLDWLVEALERNRVDLLIPGIEQDAQQLSAEREKLGGCECKFALNRAGLIELCRDKWAMDQELLALGEPSRIPSYLEGGYDWLAARLGVPFILKRRRGHASKGLVRVTGAEDFRVHAHRLGEGGDLMAQPVIGSDDEEFTVGAFGDGGGGVWASITLRRRLGADGSTVKAWVRREKGLDETVARLCGHFRPVGPTNLQFRRDGEGWKLLEINPRVSSTTSIRRAFGYNEALMSLEFFLEGKAPRQPALPGGGGFAVRFIEDYVVHDRDHF